MGAYTSAAAVVEKYSPPDKRKSPGVGHQRGSLYSDT
jgi:hypothetical protein